jgi:EAL domain-containing protein (putative c-di-GMP-specific phosphodiesterase class I)
MVGVEALLRWSRPDRPPVSPATFVPVLEDCGLIGTVGLWVLREAARQMTEWQHLLGDDLKLSVNVSAEQLGRPDLLEAVSEAFAGGLAPGTLCLEVTETALVGCADGAGHFLDRLRAAGAAIVLDDFGTGYSSLSHLVDFPLDALKIDRSFVAGLGVHAQHTAVTEAVVALAGRLDLGVVAEGVETVRQLDAVRDMGCDYGQGYLWSEPVPAEGILAIARSGRLAGRVAELRPA